MSRLEMLRAQWIRHTIVLLQEMQHKRWTVERCKAISALQEELSSLIRYK